MNNLRLITDNLLSKNVSIVFQTTNHDGKISKFTKTLSNITETASHDDIYAAADAISKLYEHDKFDVKLITTNLIEDDLKQIEKDVIIETIEKTL